jgi:hypothetical protein
MIRADRDLAVQPVRRRFYTAVGGLVKTFTIMTARAKRGR